MNLFEKIVATGIALLCMFQLAILGINVFYDFSMELGSGDNVRSLDPCAEFYHMKTSDEYECSDEMGGGTPKRLHECKHSNGNTYTKFECEGGVGTKSFYQQKDEYTCHPRSWVCVEKK